MKFERKISAIIILSQVIFILIVVILLVKISKLNFKTLENNFFKIIDNIYINHKKEEIKKNVYFIINEIDMRRKNLKNSIKRILDEDVNKAYNIAYSLYNKFHTKIPDDKLKDIIIENIKALSPEDRYYFIFTTNGKEVSHPIIPAGKNIINFKDAKGEYIVKKMINLAISKNQGFIDYYWYKLNSKKMYKKITYVKLFKPYNWIIGMGYYYDDMEKHIQDEMIQFIKRAKFEAGKSDYFFVLKVVDKNNVKVIINPFFNKITNVYNIKDARGNYFIKEILKISLNKGQGYINYLWKNPDDKNVEEKISFVKYYPKWKWIIGKGFYVSVINKILKVQENKIKKEINKNLYYFITIFFAVSIIFLIVGCMIVYYIYKRLKYYREQLTKREEFQKYLINTIPVPLFIKNFDGIYVDVNVEFEKFFNVKEKDLINRKIKNSGIENDIDILDKIIDADIFIFKKYHDEKLIQKSEIDLFCSRGELKKVIIVKSLYKDLNGNYAGIIGVIFDITKQKQLEEKLMEMSIRDELTRLYNRRYFNEILKLEVERAKRYNHPLSLIYFDIDFFKKINDTYGHSVGDIILKELSNLIKKNLRKVDYLFRIGGEEFVILLINCSLERAYYVAEKLRKIVESTEFPVVKKVTVSFGVTNFRKSDTEDSFVQRADEALYKAKNSGRNKVVIL